MLTDERNLFFSFHMVIWLWLKAIGPEKWPRLHLEFEPANSHSCNVNFVSKLWIILVINGLLFWVWDTAAGHIYIYIYIHTLYNCTITICVYTACENLGTWHLTLKPRLIPQIYIIRGWIIQLLWIRQYHPTSLSNHLMEGRCIRKSYPYTSLRTTGFLKCWGGIWMDLGLRWWCVSMAFLQSLFKVVILGKKRQSSQKLKRTAKGLWSVFRPS